MSFQKIIFAAAFCVLISACASENSDKVNLKTVQDENEKTRTLENTLKKENSAGSDFVGKDGQELLLTPKEVDFYLKRVVGAVAGRSLKDSEVKSIEKEGAKALRPILEAWVQEPGFSEFARFMIQKKLTASGNRDGIDFDLPGNLAAHLVRQKLPYSDILTADYCVAKDGKKIPCDSGAPYSSGVLTTRAFLTANASRFNLHRASTLMRAFACTSYPLAQSLEPSIPKEKLIPLFRANTAEEQTVKEGVAGFGNGTGCYSCHSQFGPHAQLFVKFDKEGVWKNSANGLQDPQGELGRSLSGLMTSHMSNPAEAASESSQFFGQTVSNLQEAAQIFAKHPLFYRCSVRNVLDQVFSLGESNSDLIDLKTIEHIVQKAKMNTQDAQKNPTLADIVVETLLNPQIANAAVAAKKALPQLSSDFNSFNSEPGDAQ